MLLSMGREPICKCGNVKLWHGVVVSSENSQHIARLVHAVARHPRLRVLRIAVAGRAAMADRRAADRRDVIEGGWEILENTPLIINRYREATIALDYYGDSVLNSVCDIGWMMLGFVLASRLPIWATIALIVDRGDRRRLRDSRQPRAEHPDADLSARSGAALAGVAS